MYHHFLFLLSFLCLESSIHDKNNYKLYNKLMYKLLQLRNKYRLDDMFLSINKHNNMGIYNSQHSSNDSFIESYILPDINVNVKSKIYESF